MFEVFVALRDAVLTHYLEVEINPNNALLIAKIVNPNLQGNKNTVAFSRRKASKIIHHVTVDTSQKSQVLPTCRINFFRKIAKEAQINPHWTSTPKNSLYLYFNTTNASETPNFYRTNYGCHAFCYKGA